MMLCGKRGSSTEKLAKNFEGLQRHLIRVKKQILEDMIVRDEGLSRLKQLNGMEDTRDLLRDEERERVVEEEDKKVEMK